MKLFLLRCLLFFVLLPSSLTAQEPVQVGLILFPPYAQIDDEGNLYGISVDQLGILFAEIDLQAEFSFYPITRLYEAFYRGDVELILSTSHFHANNREIALISEKAILEMQLRMVARSEKELNECRTSLKGKRVGFIRGYTFSNLVDLTDVIEIRTDTHLQLIQLLQAGKVDCLIDYRYPILVAMKEAEADDLPFTILMKNHLHIILHKQVIDSAALMQKINQVIEKMEPIVPADTGTP